MTFPPSSLDLAPEEGPLRLYNWADYINPDVIPLAEEALGVPIEVTIFYNEEEAFAEAALRRTVRFDVWFPAGESIGKAVAGKLIQPLNHDYLPNLDQFVWPQLVSPFYDQGSQYTVPYVVYQTGIGWRNDMVDAADIEGQRQPVGRLLESQIQGNHRPLRRLPRDDADGDVPERGSPSRERPHPTRSPRPPTHSSNWST